MTSLFNEMNTISLCVDVLIVAFKPSFPLLKRVLVSLNDSSKVNLKLRVHILHNDDTRFSDKAIRLYDDMLAKGLDLKIFQASSNGGFGLGINELAEIANSPFYLVLNQDAIPEPGAIENLLRIASQSNEEIAMWEMRQIPYEHPKIYKPSSLETPWVSGAAFLIRSSVFKEVSGFDPRIFMYGEDVDLSWRIRALGYKLSYVPTSSVYHPTYSDPSISKPLQVAGSVYSGLCLRARFSRKKEILKGLIMAIGEMCVLRQEFPGRRALILQSIFKFIANYAYFRNSRVLPTSNFAPYFNGWSYEERRLGAFYEFKSISEYKKDDLPLISILIRTCNRPEFFREALKSAIFQTWPNLEIVVVEDGSFSAQSICQEYSHLRRIKYFQVSPKRGRSFAGNKALSLCEGEWINFLDDDDQLFADHCQVLHDTCLKSGLLGAYSLAWRVFTEVFNYQEAHYKELARDVCPNHPFDRQLMWKTNLFPIQSALFNRKVYELYGGFNEDMDQLEDWNMWCRYTLNHDFQCVQRVTSLYRVPADNKERVKRQASLDDAYAYAIQMQDDMILTTTVSDVKNMIRESSRSNNSSNLKFYLISSLKRYRSILYIARLIQAFINRSKLK